MGRLASFDRSKVLDSAMLVFWRQGYNATSVADLVDATQLQPGSLYGAFQNKRGLFMEVIDTYADRSLARIEDCLKKETKSIDGIFLFFERISDQMETDSDRKGCLLVKTLLEFRDDDPIVADKVTAYLRMMEGHLFNALIRARLSGEIAHDADCRTLSKALISSVWGLRVMSATQPEKGTLKKMVKVLLTTIPTIPQTR
jgi:TetR/AcrR family transcriptional repressor of nem operon